VALLLVVPSHRLAAAALFCLASITDYLDGYLARRWRVTSTYGVFSDLMADKLLVASTLIALVSIRLAPAWMVIIIVGRELVISGLRSWASTRGATIPAGTWGKGKTLLTLIAIAIVIVDWSSALSFVLLLAATGLTLLSALDYMYQAWKIATRTVG
jgi:CDP-diacylglycerol--glycerol-3-phosphate 3-phosphatidyltransferase